MKRLNLLFAIILMFEIVACTKKKNNEKSLFCIPQELAPNVIAFYPFSNGSLNDFSGNNYNLSNPTTAGPTDDRNGNPTCAYQFVDSNSEYLTTTNTTFLNNLNEFSISLWYEALDTTVKGVDLEVLVGRDVGAKCSDKKGQWSVGLYDCRRAVFGALNSVWDQPITNLNDCQSEVIARTGSWHHIVVTFKLAGTQMTIYRDGVLQESTSEIVDCASSVASMQDIGDLFIGKDYSGKIDDVIFFNKVLNQLEINLLTEMGTCCR